jgi:hypothetical protein
MVKESSVGVSQKSLSKSVFAIVLAIWMSGFGTISALAASNVDRLAEVRIPASIAKLAPTLDRLRPQVSIVSPQPNVTLAENRAIVQLDVRGLPIFKHPELELGNHVHLILDRDEYRSIYDLNAPIVLENLTPGTHCLRAFISRPWHESFKNPEAFTLVNFNILNPDGNNTPDPQLPLLTVNRPFGNYGTQPMLMDFDVTNAAPNSGWQVRATINNSSSFIVDRLEPIYLQGFPPGQNSIRLELIDRNGNLIPNLYNDATTSFTYDDRMKSTFDRLIDGEIPTNLAQSIVDPSLIAVKPSPAPQPVPSYQQPAPVEPPPVATQPFDRSSAPMPSYQQPPTPVYPPQFRNPTPNPQPFDRLPSYQQPPTPTYPPQFRNPTPNPQYTYQPPSYQQPPIPNPQYTYQPPPANNYPPPSYQQPPQFQNPTPTLPQPLDRLPSYQQPPTPNPEYTYQPPPASNYSPPSYQQQSANPQPKPSPTLISQPIKARPEPVATLAPEPSPQPIKARSEPVVEASPAPTQFPTPEPAIASNSEPVVAADENKAIAFINSIRSQIKKFTNGIPPLAQKFGGQIKDWIQSVLIPQIQSAGGKFQEWRASSK